MSIHEFLATRTTRLLVPLAAVAASATPAAALVDYQFSALWRADAPVSTLVMADDYTDFSNQITAQSGDNQKLIAFESWEEGGVRRYAGLFRGHLLSSRSLYVDYTESDFETLRLGQVHDGRYLADVQVRLEGATKYYSGLFVSSSSSVTELRYDNLSAATFAILWNNLKSTHHLTTFDTWQDAGVPYFYAVFHPGAEVADTQLTVAASVPTFAAIYTAQTNDFRRAVNFEVTPIGLSGLISAKWVPSPVRSWLGVSFSEEWLLAADYYFIQGQPTSTYGDDLGGYIGLPTEDPMYIYDLEITELHYELPDDGNNTLALQKPLVDSGTPGPHDP